MLFCSLCANFFSWWFNYFSTSYFGRIQSAICFAAYSFTMDVSCSFFSLSHGRDSHKQVSKNNPHWRKFILCMIRHRSCKIVSKEFLKLSFLLAFFRLVPFEVVCGVIVTKLRRLHSASTWPPFRCVLVPSRQNPPGPRARLSANRLDAVSRKTGLPQDTSRPNSATAALRPVCRSIPAAKFRHSVELISATKATLDSPLCRLRTQSRFRHEGLAHPPPTVR